MRLLPFVVFGASGLAIAVFVIAALRRVGAPIELEWLEGGAVDHVRRLLQDKPLYAQPSVNYVAYEYPPVFFWTTALVSRAVGPGYLALRLVSAVASLGTMAVLAVTVRNEVGRWAPGVVAAGLFASAFVVTGKFFDVGRVDALSVFLLVACIAVVARATTWRGAAAAGVIAALAVLTKQTTALAIFPVFAYLCVRRTRLGVVFGASTAALAGAVSLVLNATSHGWYRYFVFDELRGHSRGARSATAFWSSDVLAHLWPSLVVVAIGIACGSFRRGRLLFVAAVTGMVAGSWLARAHVGSAENVLIPTFAGVALLAGLAYAELPRAWVRLGASVALLVQFALLAYNPAHTVPSTRDLAASRAFIAAVRAAPGQVFVASHPELSALAGKSAHAHSVAVWDVVRASNRTVAAEITSSIAQAVHTQRFSYVVFDPGDGHRGFPTDFADYYQQVAAPYGAGHPERPRNISEWPTEWWAPR